jgi:hypothetical protein
MFLDDCSVAKNLHDGKPETVIYNTIFSCAISARWLDSLANDPGRIRSESGNLTTPPQPVPVSIDFIGGVEEAVVVRSGVGCLIQVLL